MNSIYKWINLAAFVAMIAINALANILPIGGNTTAEVSNNIPNLFTPAPFTFGIWGVIYIFMGFFVVYQLIVPMNSAEYGYMRSGVGILFILSCLFNIGWIFSWHFHKMGLSVIFMLALLLTLIIINLRFTVGPNVTFGPRVAIYGFNIYIGWICAATIANIGVFLNSIGWTRFGLPDQVWMIVVLVVGALLGVCFSMVGYRYFATLAIVWAYFGILIKHISIKGYNNEYPLIIVMTGILMVCMLLFIVLTTLIPDFQITSKE